MELRERKITELVDDLVQEGVLTAAQVVTAQARKKEKNQDLDEALISLGFITEKDFCSRFARKLSIANIALDSFQPDPKALKLITSAQALRWQFIPLFEIEGKLTIATANPLDLNTLDEAGQKLNLDIECILTTKDDIKKAIEQHYGQKLDTSERAQPIDIVHYGMDNRSNTPAVKDADIEALGSNTVLLVDKLLQNSFMARASDIHLEPTRNGLLVRARVDGMLEQLDMIPKASHEPVLSRIKILGGMDVAEHRVPQDGRTHIKIRGKELDLRIATYPTIHGEAAAIRLLSKEMLITLEDIGLLPHDLAILEKIIHQPHGIFLVTGPTGSGKTTTLYAALQKVDRSKNHVLSVEDPVENEIEGVSQTQINVKAGVTFAAALRSSLREDPDVIMVGEIRDQETADIAFRAAMTGHLVLSTLHTNGAIATIGRLTDLGIETYLIGSTLLGVMAQRLVRRTCQHCKEERPLPQEFVTRIGSKISQVSKAFYGKGCKECAMRGYKGRLGLFELIAIDDEIRILINTKAPEVRLQEKAATLGFHTMLEDGIEKVKAGLTTPEEVLRICGEK